MKELKVFFRTDRGKYLLSLFALVIMVVITFCELLSPEVIINASDILTQDYFWHFFYKEQLRQGTFSYLTWNPYLNGGASSLSGFHQIFFPITLMSDMLLPPNLSVTVAGLLYLLLAGFFTLLYARLIGLSFAASFLAATFFILSTQLVSLFNAGHVTKLNTIDFLPVVLFFLERALRKRRFVDFVLVSLSLSIQLFVGHIQVSFYTCLLVGIYFIWRSIHIYKEKRDGKELGRLYLYGTAMVLLFFTLSAATFSQWLEFKEQSERSAGMPYELATNWSMSKTELATYIVPQLFGLSRENYKEPKKIKAFYWGKDLPFTQTANYLGMLPLVLAIIALVKCRGRYVKMFIGIAIVFLVLGMGKYTPIYSFFYHYLGFKFFRVPKMNLFVVAFAVSIIAAYGVEWLLGKINKEDIKFLKKLGFSVFGTAVFLAIIAVFAKLNQGNLMQHFSSVLQGHGRSYNPSLVLPRYEYAVEGIIIASILIFCCSAILFISLKDKINTKFLFFLMLFFFVVDVSILNNKFINAVPIKDNVFISKDTAIEYFEKDKGLYRVFNMIRDWQNPAMTSYRVTNKYILYQIQSVTGYEAVQATRYNEFFEKVTLGNRLVDLLNVKYVVVDKNAVKGTVGDRLGKYEIVVDKDVKILKNNGMLPRAFPVHRANVIKDRRKIMQWITNPGFDPLNRVFIESSPPGPLSARPLPESASKVTIRSYENEEIVVDAEMADNGFVVLSEKYYPGWNAYMNSEKVKIYPADNTLRAVYAPKGKNEIIFRYEPTSNRRPLTISMISFFASGLFIIWSFVWRNRKKVEAA